MTVARRRSLYGFEMRTPDKRRNEEGRKTHDIKQLWQRNHEILRLALLGYSAVKIAEVLGITAQTVSNTINSEMGMRKLSALRLERDKETVDVADEIARLYSKAIKVYDEIISSPQAPLSLKKETADTVLMDIGGHRAPAKIQGQFASEHLVKHELELIKARGRAAAAAAGNLVDREGNRLPPPQGEDRDDSAADRIHNRSGDEASLVDGAKRQTQASAITSPSLATQAYPVTTAPRQTHTGISATFEAEAYGLSANNERVIDVTPVVAKPTQGSITDLNLDLGEDDKDEET